MICCEYKVGLFKKKNFDFKIADDIGIYASRKKIFPQTFIVEISKGLFQETFMCGNIPQVISTLIYVEVTYMYDNLDDW